MTKNLSLLFLIVKFLLLLVWHHRDRFPISVDDRELLHRLWWDKIDEPLQGLVQERLLRIRCGQIGLDLHQIFPWSRHLGLQLSHLPSHSRDLSLQGLQLLEMICWCDLWDDQAGLWDLPRRLPHISNQPKYGWITQFFRTWVNRDYPDLIRNGSGDAFLIKPTCHLMGRFSLWLLSQVRGQLAKLVCGASVLSPSGGGLQQAGVFPGCGLAQGRHPWLATHRLSHRCLLPLQPEPAGPASAWPGNVADWPVGPAASWMFYIGSGPRPGRKPRAHLWFQVAAWQPPSRSPWEMLLHKQNPQENGAYAGFKWSCSTWPITQ